MPRSLTIVMNPASAGGKPLRVLPVVEAALRGAGADYRIVETRDIPHAAEAAREAAGRDETVVALGGDGLVGALAGALAGGAPLGVLPAGRGNDFARAINFIPSSEGSRKSVSNTSNCSASSNPIAVAASSAR